MICYLLVMKCIETVFHGTARPDREERLAADAHCSDTLHVPVKHLLPPGDSQSLSSVKFLPELNTGSRLWSIFGTKVFPTRAGELMPMSSSHPKVKKSRCEVHRSLTQSLGEPNVGWIRCEMGIKAFGGSSLARNRAPCPCMPFKAEC